MTFITETETQKKPDDHSPLYRKDSLTPDPSSPVSSDQGKYPWILTKTQYYQTIRAGLYRDDKGTYHYLIRIKRLTPDEREICRRLHEEIRKNDAVSKSDSFGKYRSRTALLSVISKKHPLVSKEKRELIATHLFFLADPTRWIKLFIHDNDITGIFCPAPDTAVLISYSGYHDPIATNIIMSRIHLDKLARLFLTSAKIDPDNVNIPDKIQFKSGIRVSLSRKGNSSGWFWRIGIQKNLAGRKEKKLGSTDGFSLNSDVKRKIEIPMPDMGKTRDTHKKKTVKSSPSKKSPPDNRIDDLLETIFSQGKPSSDRKNLVTEEEREKETPVLSSGFIDRIISPLKEGMQTLTSKKPGSRLKTPSRDPPPVPETTQVPSVMNIQAVDGVVAEEAYWLYQPHAYAVIIQDKGKERSYRVVEPE
ncbi:MAG: hypothetical protein PHD71_06570, partial [Methanospirillum sp.]|nr:hypothetical protein [Methanospirillum sp.]